MEQQQTFPNKTKAEQEPEENTPSKKKKVEEENENPNLPVVNRESEYILLPTALRIQKTQILTPNVENSKADFKMPANTKFSDFIDIKVDICEERDGKTWIYATFISVPPMDYEGLREYFGTIKLKNTEELKKTHFSTWATLDWWVGFFGALNKSLIATPEIFVFKRSFYYANGNPWKKLSSEHNLVFSNPPIYQIEYNLHHFESFENKILSLPPWVTKIYKENPFDYQLPKDIKKHICAVENDVVQSDDGIDTYMGYFLKTYSKMAEELIHNTVQSTLEERIFYAGSASSQNTLKSIGEALSSYKESYPFLFMGIGHRRSNQGRKPKGGSNVPVILVNDELKMTELNSKSDPQANVNTEIENNDNSHGKTEHEYEEVAEEKPLNITQVQQEMILGAPIPSSNVADEVLFDVNLTNPGIPMITQSMNPLATINQQNFDEHLALLAQKPLFGLH
jgi:hypothetical protein